MRRTKRAAEWNSSQFMTCLDYEVNYYSDRDFGEVELHSHDFFELYFFLGGGADYLVENMHYRLLPGDMLLIPPGNLHRPDLLSADEEYRRIVLWLNPRYVKRLSTPATDLAEAFAICAARKDYLLRGSEVARRVEDLLFDLNERDPGEKFGDDVECEIRVREILLTLTRTLKESALLSPGDTLRRARADATVTEIIEFIDANLEGDLSLDAVAEKVFLNKFYLARLFKRETDTTLHRFILKKRLLLSKKLIESGLPIVEVYARCGFKDYSHFFRAFKGEYGITPRQYHAAVTEGEGQ